MSGKREKKDKLSEKEKKNRIEEDELFKKMAAPPRAFDIIKDGLGETTESFPEEKKKKKNFNV